MAFSLATCLGLTIQLIELTLRVFDYFRYFFEEQSLVWLPQRLIINPKAINDAKVVNHYLHRALPLLAWNFRMEGGSIASLVAGNPIGLDLIGTRDLSISNMPLVDGPK